MIEQQAEVTQCDEQTVWLKAQRQSTCSACQMKQGCGTGLLANHVGKRFSHIKVDNTTGDVHVGQQVKLAIPEQALLNGAFLMYMLPLAFLFLFSAIAQALSFNDGVEIFAGLSGLFIGFYLVQLRLKSRKNNVHATIVKMTEEKA